MKKFRNALLFIAGCLLFILTIGVWYKITYSMHPATSRQIHSETLTTKVLIATQGSDFKNAVVTNIVNQYKLDSVFLNIIDVNRIGNVNAEDYQAIVILHTWEYGKPPSAVKKFLEQNSEYRDKTIVFTTSGEGTNKMAEIDALTGESILENASDHSDEIIERINKLIE